MARPPFDHFRFVAPIYDRVFTADGSDHAALREALALPAEGLLLDAGGGTGRVSAHLRSYTGGVVVVDVSRGMLAQAREKNALLPALGQVERLPFADGQFARILIVDAFHHFFHHAEAVEDLWRVLAPGGRLVILEPNIARWPVRLIALAETLLLMRSRFYTAAQLTAMFSPYQNARVAADVESNPFQIVLKVDKAV